MTKLSEHESDRVPAKESRPSPTNGCAVPATAVDRKRVQPALSQAGQDREEEGEAKRRRRKEEQRVVKSNGNGNGNGNANNGRRSGSTNLGRAHLDGHGRGSATTALSLLSEFGRGFMREYPGIGSIAPILYNRWKINGNYGFRISNHSSIALRERFNLHTLSQCQTQSSLDYSAFTEAQQPCNFQNFIPYSSSTSEQITIKQQQQQQQENQQIQSAFSILGTPWASSG
ncbi:uncharacterized protein TRIREDRAFT_104661 [Trichoderma reesei QM6a]|uniref:Predicted protein n=1 Tax=Hypocrea jecorina (strain QM6a) TaxID=431241 RepID=G0RDB8_HYPJQ|nr:uncharacterized protein TRIREDRAFT_104661 [Trichoderma reesei QM6a]EGR50547.1 predicted protein [Trichoderma reesei QM6a]